MCLNKFYMKKLVYKFTPIYFSAAIKIKQYFRQTPVNLRMKPLIF